jgi:hypothetical protein
MEVGVVYGQYLPVLHMQCLKFGAVAPLETVVAVVKWDIHQLVDPTVKKH